MAGESRGIPELIRLHEIPAAPVRRFEAVVVRGPCISTRIFGPLAREEPHPLNAVIILVIGTVDDPESSLSLDFANPE